MSSSEDIPKPLTKLIRLIMRGFYSIEQKLVIDVLVRRRETKEDDLVEVLKFERKNLRSLIQQMKQDKFINVRHIMETDEDGKSTRRNYYSVNYRMFVNVVKYKIDHMRRKLETEERDLTSRASFICQSCNKTYTDLEVGQIFARNGQDQGRCSYCNGIVDEDPNASRNVDSRAMMVKFNKQMEPVYALLQETENIKWSIIEVDGYNITVTNNVSGDTSNGNIASASSTSMTNGSLVPDQQIQGSSANAKIQVNYPVKVEGLEKARQEQQTQRIVINPEVEALLLREETLANSTAAVQESSHDEDENTASPTLLIDVGSTKVPVDMLADEHIKIMSLQQKDEYQRLMRQVYNLVHD